MIHAEPAGAGKKQPREDHETKYLRKIKKIGKPADRRRCFDISNYGGRNRHNHHSAEHHTRERCHSSSDKKQAENEFYRRNKEIYHGIIIGAGTAGLVTAAGTATLGGRVALIERNLMGGDCLNFGCVPSKALILSARLIQRIRESEKGGLDRQQPQFAFEKVFQRMRARRAKISPNDSQERFESLGVKVFRGEARFVSPHEVEVNGQKLRART